MEGDSIETVLNVAEAIGTGLIYLVYALAAGCFLSLAYLGLTGRHNRRHDTPLQQELDRDRLF